MFANFIYGDTIILYRLQIYILKALCTVYEFGKIYMATYGLLAATICDNSIFYETIRY